jgi:hypothetical protein
MTIRSTARVAAAAALALSLAAGVMPARAEDEKAVNLKVLPKDISGNDLHEVMNGWSQALGVRCDFCHEMKTPGDFRSIDWPSDKIGHKEVARRMYTMMTGLNATTLPKAAGEPDAAVSCVTCHRGLPTPTTLDRVLVDLTREKGADAAVGKYKELRERYYGSGTFDFTPRSLQSVALTLADDKATLDAALVIAKLNVEQNPTAASAQVVVAQVLELKQDKVGALAAVEAALKLDPKDRHAQRLKQQLTQ